MSKNCDKIDGLSKRFHRKLYLTVLFMIQTHIIKWIQNI